MTLWAILILFAMCVVIPIFNRPNNELNQEIQNKVYNAFVNKDIEVIDDVFMNASFYYEDKVYKYNDGVRDNILKFYDDGNKYIDIEKVTFSASNMEDTFPLHFLVWNSNEIENVSGELWWEVEYTDARVDSLKAHFNDLLFKYLFIDNDVKNDFVKTEIENNDFLSPEEVLVILIDKDKRIDSRKNKGYTYAGVDKETSYYKFSWANSGKGSGASLIVNPSNGDVYCMNQLSGNLFDEENNAFFIYQEFLDGKVKLNYNNRQVKINDIFLEDEKNNKYTFFDSNNNGIIDLHLLSRTNYIIVENVKNELKIIYEGSSYETLLNNGDLMYERVGAAPEHITYKYIKINKNNTVSETFFETYNTKNQNFSDDLYLLDGKKVDKIEFDKKTKEYFEAYLDDDIVWRIYNNIND